MGRKRTLAITAAEDRLLTVEDAAERLAVSKSTMYELIGQGELQSVQVGGRSRRVRLSTLIQFMNALEGGK